MLRPGRAGPGVVLFLPLPQSHLVALELTRSQELLLFLDQRNPHVNRNRTAEAGSLSLTKRSFSGQRGSRNKAQPKITTTPHFVESHCEH